MLAQLIILSFGITKCFSSPVKGSKSAAELDYEESVIIQPIRNEDIPPQLCVLSYPFDATSGGKIFLSYIICYSTMFAFFLLLFYFSHFLFFFLRKIACEIF